MCFFLDSIPTDESSGRINTEFSIDEVSDSTGYSYPDRDTDSEIECEIVHLEDESTGNPVIEPETPDDSVENEDSGSEISMGFMDLSDLSDLSDEDTSFFADLRIIIFVDISDSYYSDDSGSSDF